MSYNYNIRKYIYYEIIKQIPEPNYNVNLLSSGKLSICLIEYRKMPEIKYVLNAVLQIYKDCEIGISVVCGNNNAEYVNNLLKSWNNIRIINTGHDNLNRGTYSALLKMPIFWELFTMWEYVLVYQTDALLLRKIEDIYFTYDYIGARWKTIDNWLGQVKPKYNGGNGGLSLRHVKSMIEICESNRNLKHNFINTSNEDAFFCTSDKFKYPDDIEIHKQFSVEEIFVEKPIGCHQVYRWLSDKETYTLFNYIRKQLNIEKKTDNVLIFKLFGGWCGVGYFNQIFSLELAIFMSNYFKRKLYLIIEHPFAERGIPMWELGYITDYINHYIDYLLPYGYKIFKKDDLLEIDEKDIFTIHAPNWMSSCYYVDSNFRSEEFSKDVLDFGNDRNDISIHLDVLFDYRRKFVRFKQSNASRMFYNFYTTQDNYKLMSKIAYHLSKVNSIIGTIANIINVPKNYIALHIRFGDQDKDDNFKNRESSIITNNIINWLHKNQKGRPILIMTDNENHNVIINIRSKFCVKLTSELYDKTIMKKYYKNPNIANFLMEKELCHKADIFVGTRTSTVSVHVNYVNYINNKEYTHYLNYSNWNFDKEKLEYLEDGDNKWSWKRYNYDKGHPITWTLFFKDNVII